MIGFHKQRQINMSDFLVVNNITRRYCVKQSDKAVKRFLYVKNTALYHESIDNKRKFFLSFLFVGTNNICVNFILRLITI